ncbi:MAG: MaoC/PaaZ C-terminal domain-containing protein [Pseudomonadota bacterium]
MHIDSSTVGTRLLPYTTEVNARQTANYAAAVGETAACYFDDTASGGVIAHPVFPVAVTWPITLHMDRYLQDRRFPLELMATQVHHTEHIAIHRPIRPGQALTVAGTVAAILPHRAGTRVVMRYEAAGDDGPVFTEHIGALLRGVTCTDAGRSLSGMPPEPPSEQAQTPLWQRAVAIDPALPYIYDGCSDIVFPIHTSPAFARAVGLPGIILQGTATLALAVREVLAHESGAGPAAVTDVACRFTGMVFPGNRITVRLHQRSEANDRVNLDFDVTDETDRPVLRNGRLAYRPPTEH